LFTLSPSSYLSITSICTLAPAPHDPQALRRRVYTTPKSYLDLIKLYIEVLAARRKVLNENRRRLEIGLTKLRETNETVAQLQEKVKEFQPKVLQKAADAEVMLKKVAIDQQDADVTKVWGDDAESIVL
jgi:dynein heavy chain